jgi:hypothetical protein
MLLRQIDIFKFLAVYATPTRLRLHSVHPQQVPYSANRFSTHESE